MADVFHDRHARGRTRTGWLNAHHTFSFGSFNDPTRMGFRALRVINEDVITGGSWFPEHAHDHFDILTFMLAGTLAHSDSAGHRGLLHAGDVQCISAGSGIRHTERNPSPDMPTHLFQIWLHADADKAPPRYQLLRGALDPGSPEPRLIADPGEQDDALRLRAPVRIWASRAGPGTQCAHALAPGRFGWLQLLEGVVEVDAQAQATALELRGGDALQLSTVRHLTLRPTTAAAWLWFDLP
ncbi:pirin family protein [Azohydromonas australica]|uniref:pirin family protein n=1 Tax=Azohydromonas australica TaxID=364039 RepID=UPI00048ACB6E|nr:pirin family protein [Azohydromonas australica]